MRLVCASGDVKRAGNPFGEPTESSMPVRLPERVHSGQAGPIGQTGYASPNEYKLMKQKHISLAALSIGSFLTVSANAASIALDDGSDYTAGAQITESMNGGTGLLPWDIHKGFDPGQPSWSAFTSKATGADTSFNIYSTGDVGQVIRNLDGSLNVGQTFSFSFKLPSASGSSNGGGIGFGDPGTLGGDDLIQIIRTGTANAGVVVSGGSTVDTGIVAAGNILPTIDVAFTLDTATTWSLDIGNGTYTTTGITDAPVDSVRMYYLGGNADNNASTGNIALDNIAVVPEPGTAALVLLGACALMRRSRKRS